MSEKKHMKRKWERREFLGKRAEAQNENPNYFNNVE